MPSFFAFPVTSRTVTVGLVLAGAVCLAQAANVYAPDSKTLTVPVVNVPGLGSFDAQLVSTGANALPQTGTVFKLTRLVSSREPSSQPAGYLFSDETVMLPAVAVRSPDGTISYFDVKLRNISGASADTFVVDSIQDTILGRPGGAAGPKGEKGERGDKGETGERGAQGPAGPAGAPGAAGPQGIAGKDGAAGLAGANGINGTNGMNGLNGKTLLSGSADPTPSEGSDGDFYLNRVTNTLFGPKAANVWPAGGTSLKGPAGAQGVQGETGLKGDAGAVGPAGAKGDIGPQGLQGAKGDTGAPGLTGAQGLQGPIGPQGPQGPKGDSASSKAVHGCFNGAAASASGTGYTATRTSNSYTLAFTGLTMTDTNYTLLIDARTSTGRSWAIGALKLTNGMTLTGGWLDSAETLGQICFLATE